MADIAQDRYTLTYRAAEARQVMDWIRAGQSGCLVGLRGAGKSNFLRFLLYQDVRQYYLGQGHADFTFVLVDLLALADCAEWAVYELMLDRMVSLLDPLGATEDAIAEMESLAQEVRRSRNSLVAQRAVERCVDAFCQRPAQRIVLFFDEFDAVFGALDPPLFRCLRAIRDAHVGQVSYLVTLSDDPACLRSDLAQVDHFYRLVSHNICFLGPYVEADARQMIRHLSSQWVSRPMVGEVARLIELSGGHAGLLKAIVSLLWNAHQGARLADIAPSLKDESVVQAECRKVWNGLSSLEQAALSALVAGAWVDPRALYRLECRGLTRQAQAGIRVFSPLFAEFVRQQVPPATKGLVVSRSPRRVQIGGRHVETLTELEFEMLCYLYEHRGRVCTKDELIENVYRQRYGRMAGGVSDEALQTLIARLRAKVEPDRHHPRYVVTVRGEGYRFVDAGT